MSYMVVDDFCDALDSVRDSAFAAGFDTWNPKKGEVGSSVYEGMGFWGDHATMVEALMRAVNGVVVPNTMFFRVTNEGTERAYIHSDRQTGNYTCVAYLTEHEQDSGTAFFRHKRTGLTAMPSFQQMQEMGIFEELKTDMVSRDPDKWVEIDRVRGVKNRALIFTAPLFHSRYPLEGIGATLDTGRMVWVSHFYKIGPSGQLA